MHVTVIRSGSSGNCTLVEHDTTRVLIDAGGQSQRALAELFEEAELDPASLDAILVTHLHRDHINIATMRLAQTFTIPVWMHEKNISSLGHVFNRTYRDNVAAQMFKTSAFQVGSLTVIPFGLSHDAVGTTNGFKLHPHDNPACSLAYAADLGHVTPQVLAHFLHIDTLFLESNHEVELLWNNPRRPYCHKKRVSGPRGHLSNQQCVEALVAIAREQSAMPRRVILGHLSGDHNSPQMAADFVGAGLATEGIAAELAVAYRDRSTPRYAIESVQMLPMQPPKSDGEEQISLF